MRILQKLTTLIFAILLVLQIPSVALAIMLPLSPFKDVNATSVPPEYYDSILYVKEKGYMVGYSDDTFRPNNSITRAEFLKTVMQFSVYANDVVQCKRAWIFTDVDTSSQFYEPIWKAYCLNYISGFSDHTFRPDDPVTFVQASKIMTKIFFPDVQIETTDPWYKTYVETMEKHFAIPTTVLSIDQQINRAEMAQMIHTLKENLQSSSNTYAQIVSDESVWISYSLPQCEIAPWVSDWNAKHPNENFDYNNEIIYVMEYYSSIGLKPIEAKFFEKDFYVCMACGCPSTRVLEVRINKNNIEMAKGLGFQI